MIVEVKQDKIYAHFNGYEIHKAVVVENGKEKEIYYSSTFEGIEGLRGIDSNYSCLFSLLSRII